MDSTFSQSLAPYWPTAIPLGWHWLPNVVLFLAYVFIVWEKVPKVVVALLGSSLVLLTPVFTQAEALQAIDFNVIALLVGMMILVNILGQTGALDALAYQLAKWSRGHGVYLFGLLGLSTALISAFLDNVTAVLLIGSVTVRLCGVLGLNPIPYLVIETLFSNIGGTATLVGDPPNIMIGSAANLSFNDFLMHLAPVVILSIIPAVLLLLIWWYRLALPMPASAQQAIHQLSVHEAITDRPLMTKALWVLGFVVLGFLTHHLTHIEAGTIALAGASVLMLFEHRDDIWNDVEWTTIFFFIGLFVMVGAVEKSGTLGWLAEQLLAWTQGSAHIMALVMLWGSAILSALVDNIPYTATMIPLIHHLQRIDPVAFANVQPIWWSLALGACLGGNATIVGAMANVLVVDMARRQGYRISFAEFLRVGGLVTVVSLIISTLYLQIRYF
ncbi:MAG: ArsB/NhaD family transporter [Vampirovibrionales bacterium]